MVSMNVTITIIASILLLASVSALRAQETSLGAVVGIHGLQSIVPEIGLGYTVQDDNHVGMWHGYTLSAEISPGEDRTVLGLQAGAWWTPVFLNLGASLLYYTDSRESALRLRPEIGVGRGNFRLIYGLSLPMVNPTFQGIPRQELSLRWILPIMPLGK